MVCRGSLTGIRSLGLGATEQHAEGADANEQYAQIDCRWPRVAYEPIYIVKEDSVPCIVTKTVTQTKVENKLKWWQKGLMWLGSMAILLGISCIYVILRK